MDIRKIKKLIDLLEDSNLSELEIEEGEESIRLSRHPQMQSVAPVMAAAPSQIIPAAAAPEPQQTPQVEPVAEGNSIKSPMVGTFYSSPKPDADDFVKVGDQVQPGQVLCIIEAMKIFNQIEADKAGTITSVLKQSGDPVEFDEPLFIIK